MELVLSVLVLANRSLMFQTAQYMLDLKTPRLYLFKDLMHLYNYIMLTTSGKF